MTDFSTTPASASLLLRRRHGHADPGRATSRSTDFWGQENCSEILNLAGPT